MAQSETFKSCRSCYWYENQCPLIASYAEKGELGVYPNRACESYKSRKYSATIALTDAATDAAIAIAQLGNTIAKDSKVRQKLSDIDLNLSWGKFARDYFSRSASWFYNKLNGIDGNGGEGGFTPDELQQLKGALCDLADRIRRAADTL